MRLARCVSKVRRSVDMKTPSTQLKSVEVDQRLVEDVIVGDLYRGMLDVERHGVR